MLGHLPAEQRRAQRRHDGDQQVARVGQEGRRFGRLGQRLDGRALIGGLRQLVGGGVGFGVGARQLVDEAHDLVAVGAEGPAQRQFARHRQRGEACDPFIDRILSARDLDQIAARMERENRKNALLSKEIQAKKDKSNEFAHKGGRLRLVAKRMREKAEEYEENKVVELWLALPLRAQKKINEIFKFIVRFN